MTRLAAAIGAATEQELLDRLALAQAEGAEAVEVRLDYLRAEVDLGRIVRACRVPILWTNRHAGEGGRFEGSEAERASLLARAVAAGGDYVDVEFRLWQAGPVLRSAVGSALARARSAGRPVKLILSYHDFQRTPPDLADTVRQIEASEADVVKFAVMAGDLFDTLAVLDLASACPKPVIGLAMGPAGELSRILARKLGAELTFAALHRESATAPGQLTLRELREEYRWDRISPATRLAGVIGHPVEHSLSPPIHNAAYREMDFDAVYLRVDVPDEPGAFGRFLDWIRARPALGVLGFSVTIPHKERALAYVRAKGGAVDPLAEEIGAVNTIVLSREGAVSGYNTDYLGLLKALDVGAGLDRAGLRGRKVAVLGAGGVARAIVAAMTACGAEVTIWNRTGARAEALARQFGARVRPWDERQGLDADLVINGTSIGLWPKTDASPLGPGAIKPGMIVFDTVYNPLETRLLAEARSAGAIVVDGASMLVYQAEAQVRRWLSVAGRPDDPVPVEVMRRVLSERLRR